MRIGSIYIGKAPAKALVGEPRSRPGWQSSVLSAFGGVPDDTKYGLFRLLRDNIPAVDAALQTYCALVGRLEVTADEPLKTDIEAFLNSVKVGHFGRGFKRFQDQMISSKLLYGKGVGEIVPNNSGSDLYALTAIDPETVEFKPVAGASLELEVVQQQGAGKSVTLDPLLTVVSTHGGDIDPHGVSMLRSVPFVGEILLLIEEATKASWERYGCPVYHVHMTLPEGFADPSGAKTAALMTGVQTTWNEALRARKSGNVRDFFTASTEGASVEVIGAGQAVLDLQAPYRAFAEQVCAATHLPPWMLGFTWSTTERLSSNQADLLVSLVRGIAGEWLPHAERIVRLWCDMTGRQGDFSIEASPMSLQDAAETARAELLAAQALTVREKAARELWAAGVWTQAQYAQGALLDGWDGEIATAMDEPPAAAPAVQRQPLFHAHGEFAGDGGACTEFEEQPKDKRIARAIIGMKADIDEAFGELRKATWAAFGLPGSAAFAVERIPDDVPFDYTPAQMRVFNRAVDLFVKRMAGKELTKAGFVSPDTGDGIIQTWDRFAYGVGLKRASEATGAQAATLLPERNADGIAKLLSDSFDNLSENGELRIGAQLDGIREVLQAGLETGANPLDVAGDLAEKFQGYKDYEWERLARTEIAFAQNRGMKDEFTAEGYSMDGIKEEPPFHPNCMCSLTIDTETKMVTYDIALEACDLCRAYLP